MVAPKLNQIIKITRGTNGNETSRLAHNPVTGNNVTEFVSYLILDIGFYHPNVTAAFRIIKFLAMPALVIEYAVNTIWLLLKGSLHSFRFLYANCIAASLLTMFGPF